MQKKYTRLLALALTLVMALGLLAGCGPKTEAPRGEDKPNQSETQQPGNNAEPVAVKKDLLVTLQADLETFNPRGSANISSCPVYSVMYARLFVRNNGEFINALGTSFEPVGDLAVQVKIHTDWKYSDGSLIKAEDVAYSISQAATNPKFSAMFAAVVNAEKIDEETVQINLKSPAPSLKLALTHTGASILPQAFSEKQDAAGNWDGSLASGPYMLEKRELGEYTKLVRNPYWAVDQIPELPCGDNNSLTFRFVAEGATRTILIESGESDVNPFFATADYARCKANPVTEVLEVPATTMFYVYFDCSRPPFDNKLVRKAIAYAIDREAEIEAVLDGCGTPNYTSLGKGCLGYVENPGNFSYDPEKAKALLAEAGYPNGFSTKFVVCTDLNKRNAEIIQGFLAEVGIQITVEWIDSGSFTTASLAHEIPMSCSQFLCYTDTDLVWPRQYSKALIDSNNSTSFWYNERLDEIYQEARVYDEATRIAKYEEGCRILAEECPNVPIYSPNALALKNANLKDVCFDTRDGVTNYWTMHY